MGWHGKNEESGVHVTSTEMTALSMIGMVVGNAMQKTAKVRVTKFVKHPKVQKVTTELFSPPTRVDRR